VRFFRKRDEPESESSDDALYVHLALDGAIFVIRGDTGEQLWVDREGLSRELERVRDRKGPLLYSREAGDIEPPAHIEETFRMILESEPSSIQLLEEPHPEALLPPEQRRTLTKHD
jgi:hypothetical protein